MVEVDLADRALVGAREGGHVVHRCADAVEHALVDAHVEVGHVGKGLGCRHALGGGEDVDHGGLLAGYRHDLKGELGLKRMGKDGALV